MKQSYLRTLRARGFTLIELLVVVAVIGIIAAMLFTAFGSSQASRVKKTALAELQQVQTAIENYKQTYGFYPPDNPANTATNPLLFELKGTLITNNTYRTLDGLASITPAATQTRFNRDGFVNSSISRTATDDRRAPVNFLLNFKPNQITTNGTELACSIDRMPWNYVSSGPTNNPTSFDLWVDVLVSGERWRISNWRSEPFLAP